jgi:hypothetical protein
MKLVPNIIQYLLYNSSKFHCLEHPRKGVIAKMADLVEFWLILERELVEHATRGNIGYMDLKIIQNILRL